LDVDINLDLDQKRREVEKILHEFRDVFSDVPGVTNLGEHGIELTTGDPVRSHPYQMPFALREIVDKEIDTMLELGIIEPSSSPYASPIVMVRKPDGSHRLCVDFRKVNKITTFDPEPMPQPEEIFSKFSGDEFVFKIRSNQGLFPSPHEN